MPLPTGTGFFVSNDGWFITAAHVITENGHSDGPVRNDIDHAWLTKETRIDDPSSGEKCQWVRFEYIDPDIDFVLLKVDFQANANKNHLKGKTGFPHLEVSSRKLDEGEPVFSFGYPLSEPKGIIDTPELMVGHTTYFPRLTSAIIASKYWESGFVKSSRDPKVYVLDKALIFGNSGGPIIAVETGKVHAFCSRFQPVEIPQPDPRPSIYIPSLYGIVSSLCNANILKQLKLRGIPISEK
jgi:hypothetical protein